MLNNEINDKKAQEMKKENNRKHRCMHLEQMCSAHS